MALVKVIKEYGGPESITHFPNMIKKELKSKNPGIDTSKAMPNQMKEDKKTVCKKNLAALMLDGANGQKSGELKRGMAENYVTGTSEYSKSPEMVLCILKVYKPPAGWNKCRCRSSKQTRGNVCPNRRKQLEGQCDMPQLQEEGAHCTGVP